MNTEWRRIPGVDSRYVVSDDGRVIGPKGTVLRPCADRHGYRSVRVHSVNGSASSFRVHRLVMLAFVGPRPLGMQVRHRDGNPANNAVANLCYGTPRENAADKIAHGREVLGEQRWSAKLTEADARRILTEARGRTHQSLADEFGVSRSTVSQICRGVIWPHLPRDFSGRPRKLPSQRRSQQ